MYSETLEKDLLQYAKRRSETNFNRIYAPLVNVYMWLVSKQYSTISPTDFEDVKQLVLLRVIKDIHYFKPNKGNTCFSFVRMIMSQELHKRKKVIDKQNSKTIQYNSNYDTREDYTFTTSPNAFITEYQSKLDAYIPQAPKQHRKVLRALIRMLPQWHTLNGIGYMQRIKMIAKKSKATKYIVIQTLHDLKLKGLK